MSNRRLIVSNDVTESPGSLPRLILPTESSSLNITESQTVVNGNITIPNASLILHFNLGFAINGTALRYTLVGVRDFCADMIASGATGELPLSRDPFDEDYGYGVRIVISSARPDRRITWSLLRDTLEGLWDYLVIDERFREVEFDIIYSIYGLLGRGRIETSQPWDLTSKQR